MPITRTPIVDDDGTGTTGTVLDNAWKTELYNQIDALSPNIAAGWGPYTPTWGALATAPVLGNGTITGSYVTANGITYFEIYLTMGSSTTYGAPTNWTFTLPNAPVANPGTQGYVFVMTGRGYDASAGASASIAGATPIGANVFIPYCAPNSVGANYPFVWAGGDVFQIAGMYRSA